jgi:hypothetical protein
MNSWVNRWMGAEIYFVHIGHGLLFWIVLAIVALNVPWWAVLIGFPIIVFSVWGWLAEARIVLPAANRLLSGESALIRERMTATATTRPRGEGVARPGGRSTPDPDDER